MLLAVLAGSSFAANQPVWCTGTGTARMVWFDGVAAVVGFSVTADASTNAVCDLALTEGSTIKFVAPWGSPDSFLGGSLRFGGTLSVRLGETTVKVDPPDLFALKDTDEFEWRDEDGATVLTSDHFDVRFDPGMRTLSLLRGNIHISSDLAERVGNPALAGLVVGALDVYADVRELAARIDRRPRPLPAVCDAPIGTNANLRVTVVDTPQLLTTNGFRIAVPFRVANDGPCALAYDALAMLQATVEVAVAGATGETVRAIASVPVHIDPPEACPCPNLALFPPGMTSRVSLVDAALAGGLEVSLPPDAGPLDITVRLGDSSAAARFLLIQDGPFPRFAPAR